MPVLQDAKIQPEVLPLDNISNLLQRPPQQLPTPTLILISLPPPSTTPMQQYLDYLSPDCFPHIIITIIILHRKIDPRGINGTDMKRPFCGFEESFVMVPNISQRGTICVEFSIVLGWRSVYSWSDAYARVQLVPAMGKRARLLAQSIQAPTTAKGTC